MKFNYPKRYSFIYTVLLIVVLPYFAEAQGDKGVVDFAETMYGTNDILVNGIEYIEGDTRIDGTPNLFSDNWQIGDVFIKGEAFLKRELKYNIFADKLVLKFLTTQGVQRGVIIDNNLVDSVLINGHLFFSTKDFTNQFIDKGFVEYLKLKNSVLYISYYKEHIKFYTDSHPYGRYSDTKRKVYLEMEDQYFDISKKRDFLKLFEDKKRDIKKFLRKNKIKYKKANIRDFESLLRINE
ncbi:MAG: hypothetical protein C0599_13940 [Salinivirgaceae bacterium]|nr:MAG: hypothetical protein C0599_13940 [Salinivirgaceae bacterium]